jgi:hypothetical protein
MNIMTDRGHIILEHYLEIPGDGVNTKMLAQCTMGMFNMHKYMKYTLL